MDQSRFDYGRTQRQSIALNPFGQSASVGGWRCHLPDAQAILVYLARLVVVKSGCVGCPYPSTSNSLALDWRVKSVKVLKMHALLLIWCGQHQH